MELQVPVVRQRALFINFNAVECMIPQPRCYSISISNDGANPSDPLLFVPFDSVCNACNTNDTRCIKRVHLIKRVNCKLYEVHCSYKIRRFNCTNDLNS